MGIPTSNVMKVINVCAESFGLKIIGAVSARVIGCAVLEGGIAAKIQLGHELSKAKGMYVSNLKLHYKG